MLFAITIGPLVELLLVKIKRVVNDCGCLCLKIREDQRILSTILVHYQFGIVFGLFCPYMLVLAFAAIITHSVANVFGRRKFKLVVEEFKFRSITSVT